MIEGYVDTVDGERVMGWAYDSDAPERRLLIEVRAGEARQVVVASLHRVDLEDAGKGDGRHGFVATLDIGASGAETVQARVLPSGQELGGSPIRTDIVTLVARSGGGAALDCLRAEAQFALLALTSTRRL